VPISIDHAVAKEILYEEAENVINQPFDALTQEWYDKVTELGELCPYRKSSTFVAALGVAILAKSVNTAVDVYSILDRDGRENSYSARSLADGVWAKERAYIGVDLGANGANPLNNTPFVGRARIDAIENVRNKDGQAHLFTCLDQLALLSDTPSARAALRGFIAARKITSNTAFSVGENAGDYFVNHTLSQAITQFVATDSEEGRRAQAASAGLLSLAFGRDHIDVGHINDPDRHFPLDITVYSDQAAKQVRFSAEVKDKKVSGSDILSSVEKALQFDLSNIIYIAVNQPTDNRIFDKECIRARDLGCRVIMYFTWAEVCTMCLSITTVDGPTAPGEAYRLIGALLVELGVSQDGIDQWTQLQQAH